MREPCLTHVMMCSLTGGPAERGDHRERGRADGGGDQLSEAERTDDLPARGGKHPLPLLAQVKKPAAPPRQEERSSEMLKMKNNNNKNMSPLRKEKSNVFFFKCMFYAAPLVACRSLSADNTFTVYKMCCTFLS